VNIDRTKKVTKVRVVRVPAIIRRRRRIIEYWNRISGY